MLSYNIEVNVFSRSNYNIDAIYCWMNKIDKSVCKIAI